MKVRPATARPAHVHCQLGGGGSRDQAGHGEQIEQFLSGDPLAASDALLLDQRDVGGGSAKAQHAEAEEHAGHLDQAPEIH